MLSLALVFAVLRAAENLIRIKKLPLKAENPCLSLTRAPLETLVKAKLF